MLVLSPRPFNERTSIVIGLPMTTAAYNETNPFAIKFQGPKEKVSYVLAHQPKSIDWRARNAKAHSQTPRRGRACLLLAINNSASDAPMCANGPRGYFTNMSGPKPNPSIERQPQAALEAAAHVER